MEVRSRELRKRIRLGDRQVPGRGRRVVDCRETPRCVEDRERALYDSEEEPGLHACPSMGEASIPLPTSMLLYR